DGPAARGEHDGTLARHLFDDLALADPEPLLAFTREDVRNVDPGAGFDLRVAVTEGRAHQPGEVLAHGALAGAHGAYEEDVGRAGHARGSIAEKKRPPASGTGAAAGSAISRAISRRSRP